MKNNLGKVFEQNLQSYAKKDGIFCMRIQDSDLSFAGGNSKFTNPSPSIFNPILFKTEGNSDKCWGDPPPNSLKLSPKE